MAPTTVTDPQSDPRFQVTAPAVGLAVAVALAEAVVESGFDAHVNSIDLLLADARRRRLSPVLIEVVADVAEPTPVRERALGRLLLQWERVDPRPVPDLASHTAFAA